MYTIVSKVNHFLDLAKDGMLHPKGMTHSSRSVPEITSVIREYQEAGWLEVKGSEAPMAAPPPEPPPPAPPPTAAAPPLAVAESEGIPLPDVSLDDLSDEAPAAPGDAGSMGGRGRRRRG